MRTASILAAAFLASGPAFASTLVSCDRGEHGPSLAGWCADGSFTGPVHLGILLFARTDGDVLALAQLALWTEAGDPDSLGATLRGSQLGLANFVRGTLYGAQLGLINSADTAAYGLQLGAVGNSAATLAGVQLSLGRNAARSGGIAQLGLLLNQADTFAGLQLQAAAVAIPFLVLRLIEHGHLDAERELYGFVGLLLSGVNHARTLDGVQVAGWMNTVSGEMRGVQVGGINLARTMTGLQLGLFNGAGQLRGVQLGLVNFAGNGLWKVLPVLNVGW